MNGNLFYLGKDDPDNMRRMSSEELYEISYALMNPKQIEHYELGQEIDLGYELAGIGRFRINICQQRGKPRLVCRHIPEDIKSLEELRVPIAVEDLCQSQRGLILVTGATGSGKSTTLAAMIDHIARGRSCHIITIEDPIEFTFKDRKSIITQREVGLDTPNFSRALKYSLRQDPDVILVGEMRDEETILMALTAAETGHLVLSTLHTIDAAETINRILSSISPDTQNQARAQLASVLVGVVSQRLVRKMGGKGRIPAVEILINNQRVKEMITDPSRTTEIKRVIEESTGSGMQSFDQSLLEMVSKDMIDVNEALNHCSNVKDFMLHLEGVTSAGMEKIAQPSPPKPQTSRLNVSHDEIEIESMPTKNTSK